MKIRELRKELHGKVRDMEQIDFEDIHKVNTRARMELMQEKTRELTKFVNANARSDDWDTHKMMGEYDMLAIDWVYSDKAEWEGSFPDNKIHKIIERIKKAA